MTLTVIIITLNRPDCVRRCLDDLAAQNPPPDQVIVVDGSPDARTRDLCNQRSEVLYLRNDAGPGHMTRSRNIGLLEATGEIVAFVDDDAFVHENWRSEILAPYADPAVGAVGGRVIQGSSPPQPWVEIPKIGKLLPDGELYAGFDTDSRRILEVDHMMGCNMSFRAAVLAQLGGFRDDFPGISGICEDSDMSLRVRRLGHKILYNPNAVVTHIGAPQFKGRRFDARYNFYGGHNNVLLLIRNFGLRTPIFYRFLVSTSTDRIRDVFRQFPSGPRAAAGAIYRGLAYFTGLFLGIAVGAFRRLRQGRSPFRSDAFAQSLRQRLVHHQNLSHARGFAKSRHDELHDPTAINASTVSP
ncbi:MAG TPA: glycosyltransferase [Phycisphaerae bacterium]|nr:glycosyltransferase [Phycisphaerae bacterium]